MHGGSAAYIGNKIRDKYNSEFGLNGETVYLSSEMERHVFREIDVENPYISYCGNIRLGRNDSLNIVADVLGKINRQYKLHVFSNESDKQFYKKLMKNPNIEFHGRVPYSEVKEIMNKSDIVVVVEGFDSKDVLITKYSLSTKVADALATGSNIIAFGSLDCGAIEYMKEIDCGLVSSDVKDLETGLRQLLQDVDYQKRCYDKCIDVTETNHRLDKSNGVFEGVVARTVAEYGRK